MVDVAERQALAAGYVVELVAEIAIRLERIDGDV